MAISTSSIAMICLLFVGLSIALIEIRVKRSEVQREARVATPMFGGIETRRAEGPWPECLQLSGNACVTLLELYTQGLEIELVHPDEKPTIMDKGFRVDRVRVHVDESNVVVEIPKRG